MTGTTFSQFTPVSVLPDTNGNANKVLMSTGTGALWTVVPIIAGGTGNTDAQSALDALSIGNLNLTGSAARIHGTFSGTNIAARTMFQTLAASTGTEVGVIPNGNVAVGATASSLALEDNTTADAGSTGGSVLKLEMVQGTESRVNSASRGSGTVLPLSFYVGAKHTTLSFQNGAAVTETFGTVNTYDTKTVNGKQAISEFNYNSGSPYVFNRSSDVTTVAYYSYAKHYFRNAANTNILVLGSAGQLGVGSSANYGTTGQMLLSGGATDAPTWSSSLPSTLTAVTQPVGTANTTIATTEFVQNGFVQKSQLKDIPNDLMVTAIGSLDIQFTVDNGYSTSVSSAGTPSYISSVSGATVLGNAATIGNNYTVINSTYLRNSDNTEVTGDVTVAVYHVHRTITMVIDVAKACGLSDTKLLADGVTINPAWKGNYQFSAFSALFKIKEFSFWDYTAQSDTFEYSVNMIPQKTDTQWEDADYGKYNISTTVYAAASYHSANLGARWLGIATKLRNV